MSERTREEVTLARKNNTDRRLGHFLYRSLLPCLLHTSRKVRELNKKLLHCWLPQSTQLIINRDLAELPPHVVGLGSSSIDRTYVADESDRVLLLKGGRAVPAQLSVRTGDCRVHQAGQLELVAEEVDVDVLGAKVVVVRWSC